ncbi:MAG: mechanosensitive ion channel [Magnetococcales bacterium]|nr:mechanosensitive ion channel [Magnetococcales bacterium]
MESSVWIMLGGTVLLSLLLVTTAISLPLRQLSRRWPLGGSLLSSLSLPLAVLLLSAFLVWVVQAFPVAFGHLQLPALPVERWLLFWFILLLFNLSEGLGRLYYAQFRADGRSPYTLLFFGGRLLIVGGLVWTVLRFATDLDATQLFTSTAVVAAVVGFALREVLGNLLAGLSLHLAGTTQPGQWIAIGDKEGEIVQRNWRETRIRSTGGHFYILPNSTVANSLLTYLTGESPVRRHQLDIPVDFVFSPAQICQALQEAAHSVPAVDHSFKEPDAMLVACHEQAMIYRLRFWSRTYHDRSRIEGDVLERVWYQLRRCGTTPGAVTALQINAMPPPTAAPSTPPRAPEACYDLLLRSGFVQRFLVGKEGKLLVTEPQLRRFAGRLTRRLFGPGEIVFNLGEAGENGYIHLRGALYGRTDLASLGRDAVLFQVEEGDWLGELGLFTRQPRTATLWVKEGEVELLEFSRTALLELLACHAEIEHIFYQRLARRSTQLLEELRGLEWGGS